MNKNARNMPGSHTCTNGGISSSKHGRRREPLLNNNGTINPAACLNRTTLSQHPVAAILSIKQLPPVLRLAIDRAPYAPTMHFPALPFAPVLSAVIELLHTYPVWLRRGSGNDAHLAAVEHIRMEVI